MIVQPEMRRRVVITGLGAVTPIGVGVDAFWHNLLAGVSGVGPITRFDAGDYPIQIAAEVKDFNSSDFFERKKARHLARITQYGVAAAMMALEDGEWDDKPGDGILGVANGVNNSAQDVLEETVEKLQRHGHRRALPYLLTKGFPHSTASEAGQLTGFQSDVMTISTACSSGVNAVGYAFRQIRAGHGDVFCCSGTDATIAKYVFACFMRAGTLSSRSKADAARASRPFDAKRDGGILGEGAGALLVEDLEHARRRGARIYAEILGFASSGIGYGTPQEKYVPAGMVSAMEGALASANCSPANIDYVGLHGVSDLNIDKWETQALKTALDGDAYRIPMSSVKSMIGIAQNAAGVLQLIAAVKTMEESIIAPTTNYEYPDPECDLDYVPNEARRNRVDRALVLAHGFNGSDAAVVIGKPGTV